MGGSWPEQLIVTRLRTTSSCVRQARFPANLPGLAWRGSGALLWMGLMDMAQGKLLHTGQGLLQMCGVRLFRLSMLLRWLFARRKGLRKRPTPHGVPEKCFHFPLEKEVSTLSCTASPWESPNPRSVTPKGIADEHQRCGYQQVQGSVCLTTIPVHVSPPSQCVSPHPASSGSPHPTHSLGGVRSSGRVSKNCSTSSHWEM